MATSAKPEVRRVAIYTRISSDDERTGLGVERQEQDCRARAEREKWTVTEVYCDNDKSALDPNKERPHWNRLLAAAERFEFDGILSYSGSRLTRAGVVEKAKLIDLNRRTGVRFLSIVSGDEDLETAEGEMVFNIKAVIDQAESRKLAERVQRAARQRAEKGLYHGGRRPFGWGVPTGRTKMIRGEERPELDTFQKNTKEADWIEKAIHRIINGHERGTLYHIARDWHDADLRTSFGHEWTASLTQVRQVLERWRNAGVRVHQGEPLFPPAAPLCCEPIVDVDTLKKLHAVLADRQRRSNGGRVALVALLGGIAVCGKCGSKMAKATNEKSHKDRTRVGTYRCARRNCVTINQEALDELVEEAVVAELLSDDLTANLAPFDRDRLAELYAELAEVEAGRADIASLVAARALTASSAAPSLADLSARDEAAQAELAAIQARDARAMFVRRTRDLLDLSDSQRDAEADRVLAEFLGLELEARRDLIRNLLTITVNPGRTPRKRVVIKSAEILALPE